MYRILIGSILAVFGVFAALTLIIVLGKVWRESLAAWRRSRRRVLEPAILAYAHADAVSLVPGLGGRLRLRDRGVVETVLLDHIQRVRGIERKRLGKALEDLGFVERQLQSLRSKRWWRRADGAEKLGLSGARRATERLVAALDDEVPEVRIRAAKALGSVGGRASAVPLIAALREPNRWSTIRIADVLAGMGREVVDELIAEFSDLNLPAKLAALDIIGRIRSLDAVPWLRERLHDPEPDVRARTCHALGQIGEPGSGSVLLETLNDAEWPVRAMAAKALGKIGHRDAIPTLCGALRDHEWWVRANAAESLRMMAPEGIAALEEMLEDDDVFASHQAVLMLQQAGEVDRRVEMLASDLEEERTAAMAWIDRLVRVGQTGRIRELAELHPDDAIRDLLRERLEAASPPAEGASGEEGTQ
jgi:HEAT repeat protein